MLGIKSQAEEEKENMVILKYQMLDQERICQESSHLQAKITLTPLLLTLELFLDTLHSYLLQLIFCLFIVYFNVDSLSQNYLALLQFTQLECNALGLQNFINGRRTSISKFRVNVILALHSTSFLSLTGKSFSILFFSYFSLRDFLVCVLYNILN